MNEQDYPPLPAGVRVGSATYLLMKMWVNADRAQQSARHREELLAYEVTVGNLRARLEQAQPERKPMTDGEKLYAMWHSSDANDLDDFLDGWRHAEAFHGITGDKP